MIAEAGGIPGATVAWKASAGRRIVFIGHPNVGKTTLYNRLTGMRAHTANYPGTTVEVRTARTRCGGLELEWVDLPGLYGIEGGNPDEQVALAYLREAAADPGVQVVMVVDARYLRRSLALAAHIREMVPEMVLVLNRVDLARREDVGIAPEALARELEVEVFTLSARTGEGLERLKRYLMKPCGSRPESQRLKDGWSLNACGGGCGQCPYAARHTWASELCQKTLSRRVPGEGMRRSDRWDVWLTHPLWGLLVFAGVMTMLFQALFRLAAWPMEGIEWLFARLAGGLAAVMPEGLWAAFLTDGVIAGMGGVLVFLPQIAILFLLLSLLEDTGYLARATLMMDRWMKRVGLPGKAFIPMVSAHACAIPAIMSTRTIADRRDRLVTIMVLPLLSCSARIPVYVMVTAMIFPDRPGMAGLVFTGAYALGIVAAFMVALLLGKSVLPGKPEALLLELPDYQWPTLSTALLAMYDRSWLFLKRAGTIILGISVVLWALASFPELEKDDLPPAVLQELEVVDEAELEPMLMREQLSQSYLGRLGHAAQPLFEPLGFDWKITVGVLASFAAREVVASTLAILHGMGEDGVEDSGGLARRMRETLPAPVGLSLLVFFVLALQCLPTVVLVARETKSWAWALCQLMVMTAMAYTAAWLVYRLALVLVEL